MYYQKFIVFLAACLICIALSSAMASQPGDGYWEDFSEEQEWCSENWNPAGFVEVTLEDAATVYLVCPTVWRVQEARSDLTRTIDVEVEIVFPVDAVGAAGLFLKSEDTDNEYINAWISPYGYWNYVYESYSFSKLFFSPKFQSQNHRKAVYDLIIGEVCPLICTHVCLDI